MDQDDEFTAFEIEDVGLPISVVDPNFVATQRSSLEVADFAVYHHFFDDDEVSVNGESREKRKKEKMFHESVLGGRDERNGLA